MCRKNAFSIQNMFSLVARERCMTNMKRIAVPRYSRKPTDTAAVLVPLCKAKTVPSILYTVRSQDLRTNSGEISFPGGKTDPTITDEDPIQTALRETEEEIGLSADKIEIWGSGAPVPGRNNKIMITPVIGFIANLTQADLRVNNKEVAEVFTIPVKLLCDPQNQYHTQFRNGYVLPVFVIEQYKIWGITAYITHVFLSSIFPKDVYYNQWMKKKIILDKIKDS